jgi:hypothetical protein
MALVKLGNDGAHVEPSEVVAVQNAWVPRSGMPGHTQRVTEVHLRGGSVARSYLTVDEVLKLLGHT